MGLVLPAAIVSSIFVSKKTKKRNVLEFLRGLFNDGLSTSGVGTMISAIHTILGAAKGEKIDNFYFESVMMKGFFTRRSLPRYRTKWDVNLLVAFSLNMQPNNLLSVKELNMKIASHFFYSATLTKSSDYHICGY